MTGIFNGLALKKEARLSVYLYLMTHSYLFIVPSHLRCVGVCGLYLYLFFLYCTKLLLHAGIVLEVYMAVSLKRNLLHLMLGVEGQAESYSLFIVMTSERSTAPRLQIRHT